MMLETTLAHRTRRDHDRCGAGGDDHLAGYRVAVLRRTCLWVASSAWRFAAIRQLSARIMAAVERKVLRRSPEWEIDLVYPPPRPSAALAPSALAVLTSTVVDSVDGSLAADAEMGSV